VSALWDQIFAMTFADQENCLALWREHMARLKRRAEILDSMQIRALHFHGNGTDLTVGLSERSRFLSGRKATPHGIDFCPNIPTFEAYTTPDWRKTEGVAVLTRPAIINGTKVDGLRITFEKGEIVDTQAESNVEAYRALIAIDPGSRRLGEIALVGTDSPIFKSGLVFEHTLYDENAACHFATGRAYLAALRDGDDLSPEQRESCGYNHSKTHQDVMISNESVTVDALLADGKRETIIKNGAWEPKFMRY
jgi:aminopeptidase